MRNSNFYLGLPCFIFKGCLLFPVLGILFCLPACRPVHHDPINVQELHSDSVFSISLNQKPSDFYLSIANAGNQSQTLYFTPKSVDVLDNAAILHSILKAGMSDKDKAIAIWKFFCLYTYHCYPVSQSSQKLHNPAELINAFGCGFCDDLNSSIMNLARLAGLKSRVMGLNGHAIAEVYFDGGWHYFDADARVYFERKDGHIYSLHELAQNATVFDTANLTKVKRTFLRKKICSEEDNYIDSFPVYIDSNYQSAVLLPENSGLYFRAWHYTFWSDFYSWLSADTIPRYNHQGKAWQTVELKNQDKIIRQELPFAIRQVHVRSYGKQNSTAVYYSADGKHWSLKGRLSNHFSNITFIPYDSTGEVFTMGYYLKFVPEATKQETAQVTIENEIMFSDRVLFNNPDKSFRIVSLNHTGLKGLDIQVKAK